MQMQNLSIPKLLLKMSPPVMLALLIQSIYNVVDSYFVSMYSQIGLAALSLVYPIQLLMTAVATGTGTGLNILISRADGTGQSHKIPDLVRNGLILGLFNGLLFVVGGLAFMDAYFKMSSSQPEVWKAGIEYFRIVCIFAPGMFLEANCSKMLQAKGDMVTPMIAQVAGALANIVLDPLFIFGAFGLPALGCTGAAIATIIGQWTAMVIVGFGVFKAFNLSLGHFSMTTCLNIYKEGLPTILSQALCTLYVVGLNLVLKPFSEDAVTVLGIYYKIQSFFFIPLMGLQQVILPIISYNYGAGLYSRIRETMRYCLAISCILMGLGTIVFLVMPDKLVGIFSHAPAILTIGTTAFRTISCNFIPAGISLMLMVYFQGINLGKETIAMTVLRQVVLLVPLAWLLSFLGLDAIWYTFPLTEIIVAGVGLFLYFKHPLPQGKQMPKRAALSTPSFRLSSRQSSPSI